MWLSGLLARINNSKNRTRAKCWQFKETFKVLKFEILWNIKNEEFNEDEITFEADTDKISDWKPSDEFKVDKSMNEKRNKKLSKKEEDDDDNGNEF